MQKRKPFLIAALIFLIIGVCVALPIEYRKAMLIVDFPYTAISVGVAVLLGMYGFMGNGIFRGLGILFLSGMLTALVSFFIIKESFLSSIIAVWIGFPVGLGTGLVFLILEGIFLKKQTGKKRVLLQTALFIAVILIGAILFFKIEDWFSEVGNLFKV